MNTPPTLIVTLAALAALTAAPLASASEAIVKKARCVACHTVDSKRVGPAYQEVAARYAGDPSAAGKLFRKVRQGGAGAWGEIAMIPHPEDKISDDDLKAAISWILSLR